MKSRTRIVLAVFVFLVVGAILLLTLPSTDRPVHLRQTAAMSPVSSSAAQQLPPEKQRAEEQEELRRKQAEQGPRAPKEQGKKTQACSAPDAQPVIEPATEAVPGVRMAPVSQTRVVFGQSIYLVWSGLDTSAEAAANQGAIVVIELPRDGCKSDEQTSTRSVTGMPTNEGSIVLTAADGALLFFRTLRGVTGTFNLATKRFG